MIDLYGQYALYMLGVLLAIFLALILTYCVGRMFGAGFFKSQITMKEDPPHEKERKNTK